jgi:hypothetical protein
MTVKIDPSFGLLLTETVKSIEDSLALFRVVPRPEATNRTWASNERS